MMCERDFGFLNLERHEAQINMMCERDCGPSKIGTPPSINNNDVREVLNKTQQPGSRNQQVEWFGILCERNPS